MASSPLARKRILVTRPAHQAQAWCAQLRRSGAEADCIPMLAIVPIDSGAPLQAIKNQILDFDQVDHAIFVSQNAVQLGCDWLDDYWPQLPQGPRYYAIGAATARALESRGLPCTSGGDTMDSEALLALAELHSVTGERVLIFRGSGGRTLIGDTLAARGARVDYCELYRRALPDDAARHLAEYRGDADAIAVHSGETLANLSRCIDACGLQALRKLPLICPSQRVADQAAALAFARPVAADNAGDRAMLAALETALSLP
ncbi:uroporphyrinogen-III synthase [Microbulbifer hainanensis]|uniref:uroporphyrinogen-III synthase n=1 Tax=Microbulbifer hainanensis TaxID=2735675 RepID=UPI00186643F7|nr:uroporphyrinogen-III synthase [Microbulbifer hainanensis]